MSFTTIILFLTMCAVFTTALIVKTNTDNLISVVQVFRHGQRNPNSWYPTDPWKNESLYDLGPGQLTKVGKKMHYELGKFSRGRYGNFLPKTYNPNWFRAQTTDVDRTHMSCQSNLAGFLKPTKTETWNEDLPWQPIPIHPADSQVFSSLPSCAIYSTEFANVLMRDPLYIALNEEFAELYQYLTNYTGQNVTSVMAVNSIYDDLHIEEQLGFELPEWSKSVYPEPMKTAVAPSFVSFSYTTEQKRLTAGLWLKTAIYDYFSEMFNDTSSNAKYQMWSGHDTNIASILNTLGAFDPHYPAFASTLFFELRNKSGSPIINIYHKDDDLDIFEPITVEGCAFDCSLSDFSTAMSDYLLDKETWEAECAANSTSFTDAEEATSVEEVAFVRQYIEEMLSNWKR